MTKYGRRESIESLSGSHADPAKDEQLKGTKIEIERKVTKILKLIKNEDQDGKEWNLEENPNKESELVELIEDFHKQYQLLHALYNHLSRELRKKGHCRKEKDVSSSSSSSSDSEYYSPDEVVSENGELRIEHWKVAESIMQELETTNLEVTDLKHKLVSTSEEKEALELEYKAALGQKQESEKIISDLRIEAEQRQHIIQKLMDESSQLKEKLSERDRAVMSSAERREVNERKMSAQIMELEDQVTVLKLELESLCSRKRELEEQIESQTLETKKLGEENLGLQARILELEVISKEKGDSAVVRKLEDNGNNSRSKIEHLMAQVNNLQQEVDSLRTQRGELEEGMACKINEASAQVKGLMDQHYASQQEMESLNSQKTESESQDKRKTQEVLRNMIQVEAMKEELARRTLDQQRMMEEKEGLIVQVKDLKLELYSLLNHKSELEEQIKTKCHETGQLRREIDRLQDSLFELEKTLTERGDEFSALQKKIEGGKNEASAQLMALTTQVNNQQQQIDSLLTQKSQLELLIESDESSESLIHLEKQNIELTSMIADQQRILKEQEDTINNLTKEYEQVKSWLQNSKLNLQLAERKMEELAEGFFMNVEDTIRLLGRRIRVAEQLHAENKDIYQTTKERFEKENRMLEKKIDEYPGIIASYEAELRRMKDLSEVGNLVGQLQCKEREESMLREEVLKLEVKATEEEREKSSLVKAVSQLEKKVGELEKVVKEKEEGMLGLGEEKREAIRQLCVGIDYHHSRCDHLKELISKMTTRNRRTS